MLNSITKIIKKIMLLDERTVNRLVFRTLILAFIVWFCWSAWDNSINSCYVMKENKDLVGTWKVPYSRSYLILHNNGTFEFHRPNTLAINCLPDTVQIKYSDSCGKIACGKWEYKKKNIFSIFREPECGVLYLGGKYSFITVGYKKRLRIISYQPSPDGYVLILDKISQLECCTFCDN
jgi:hypothetical protein